MDGGMLYVVKSLTGSVAHAAIGTRMSNPSTQRGVVPINRHVWHALQGELTVREDELRVHLGQKLRQECQMAGPCESLSDK